MEGENHIFVLFPKQHIQQMCLMHIHTHSLTLEFMFMQSAQLHKYNMQHAQTKYLLVSKSLPVNNEFIT